MIPKRTPTSNAFLSEEWLDEKTLGLEAILKRPVDGRDWPAIAKGAEVVALYLRGTLKDIESLSREHPYFLKDLRILREGIERYAKVPADYLKAWSNLHDTKKEGDPLWSYFVTTVLGKYKRDVKKLVDAFPNTPFVFDFTAGQVLSDVRAKAKAAGLDVSQDTPALREWFKTKGRDRVLRKSLLKGGYKNPTEILTDLFGFLRTQDHSDDSYGVLRDFTLGKAHLYFLDEEAEPGLDKALFRSFLKVMAQLESSGFGDAWYGPIFHVSKEHGKLSGEELEAAKKAGYDLTAYAGIYNQNQDWIILHGYSDTAADTLAHELGHRYWYKFLDRSQRLRFQDWVRTRPAEIEDTPEARQKYLDDMDYFPGDKDEEGELKPLEAVSTYGGTNAHEAFAELFMFYVRGKGLSRDQRVAFKYLLSL
jgi:hypothetical protein